MLLMMASVASLLAGCTDGLAMARAAEEAGDPKTAIQLYREHIEQEPEDREALGSLAVLLSLSGDFDGALPIQERVVALDPDDAQTRIELGFNYLNHQDEPAKAAAVMAEAVDLDPTAKNLAFLAQAQNAAGNPAGAEESLWRALVVEPGYGYPYKILLGLLEAQGRTAEALEVRQKATAAGAQIE